MVTMIALEQTEKEIQIIGNGVGSNDLHTVLLGSIRCILETQDVWDVLSPSMVSTGADE